MYARPREANKFITLSCKEDSYKIPQGYDRFVSFHDYEPTFTTDSKGRKLVTLHYNDKDSATFIFNCDAFKTEKEVWLTPTDNKHVCCIKYAHIKLVNGDEAAFFFVFPYGNLSRQRMQHAFGYTVRAVKAY